ncbi:asparagine synthase (glutamine-hydrolyzing) [Acidiluteibacter ferrifornacis]|uniref:asparagine synthase (glutamine-hydrolyzing) n=1 Tax=Acidiluteibacter ferrifornacis TaxID=2692424 RepID=A0A6N9NHR5_9FLAO|nr:asparagine synthase (glutamine-hydrolyzing) [Acidiluteibacter ferrifornacis]NBG65382.1 asparagine synthase (glutamine-hydrolyzing) [Acidiluteibacter ferrifornacis]
MCGIAGFINKSWSEKELRRMNNAIAHRGPDAEGIYYDKSVGIGLAHRRLSILDVTASANQPFYSRCGRFIMVYNGEVYNFKELELELEEGAGFKATTNSDTEIILEAFTLWGTQFVEKLNGMFAIAIWDTIDRKLNIYRDRIGIKPIYYYIKDGVFAFCSEMKGIFSILNSEELTINYASITDVLHYGYTPSNATIYNEIKKVPAGCVLNIDLSGKIELLSFWDINNAIEPSTKLNELIVKKELKELLIQSVKSQLVSDVPLGCFLSGGIDSSLVTSIAQSVADQPVKTFTIGFKESASDESKYAKQISEYLGTNHTEFILSEKDAIDQVEKLLSIYDEPFGDSSAIPTLLVSQIAKKEVTVVLSGDGGDEQFLGYGMHLWSKRLDSPIFKKLRKPIISAIQLFGNDRLKRGSMVMDYPNEQTKRSHIFSQEQYLFSQKEIQELLVVPNKGSQLQENWELARKLKPMEAQAFFDFKYYLKEDLLVKVDRASMHHSLEVRVPLLDHNLLEYTVNIDESLKYRNGESKYILKEVLYDYLPKELFNRPKKGFSIPLAKWLKSDLSYLIDNYLKEEIVVKSNIVKWNEVSELVKRFRNGENHLYNRIWILIQLHHFLSQERQIS